MEESLETTLDEEELEFQKVEESFLFTHHKKKEKFCIYHKGEEELICSEHHRIPEGACPYSREDISESEGEYTISKRDNEGRLIARCEPFKYAQSTPK